MTQKDDDGQELCGASDLISKMGRPRTLTCAKPRGHEGAHGSWSEHWTTWRDGERYTMPAPDHRDAQQLREENERLRQVEKQYTDLCSYYDYLAGTLTVEVLTERVRVLEEALGKRAPLTRCPLCHVEPKEWVESDEPGALPICEMCALDVSGPVFASPRSLLPSPVLPGRAEGGEGA